ncbi:S8 family serine peptidase [Arhodomonas sp. SL1]|uniref:S8 family serine peptidase n=1 Tax=Arhodomonas sp. SL1 TaxID=3425691 RepID=UPI003F8808F1
MQILNTMRAAAGAAAAALSLTVLSATAAPPDDTPAARNTDELPILVQGRAGVAEGRLQAVFQRLGAREDGGIPAIDVRRLQVPAQAREQVIAALARNPVISFAEPDETVEPAEVIANDPYFTDAWHLPQIGATEAWETSLGEGVTVAVGDTGVDADHADLSGKLVGGWNTVSDNTDIEDIHGHGTNVIGVVGAASDNALGVTSLAWNTAILPIRISERSDGVAYWSDIAEAITYAADQGADVINLSYRIAGSSTVESASQYMRSSGGLVVSAAGNEGTDPGFADSPYYLSIAATDSNDETTSWSNYGEFVDLAAPGVNIWTTRRGDRYSAPSGTSFSSPVTAATLALMRTANPGLGPAELEDVLKDTAVDLGEAGRDDRYGDGRVDAAAAVTAAAGTWESDTEAPTVAIVNPADNEEVSGYVTVDVDGTDNDVVDQVVLYADGDEVATDTTTPWGFEWDSTTVADGDVTLLAEAMDAAGNQATDQVSVTVANTTEDDGGGDDDGTTETDDTAPSVAITRPGDGETVSGNIEVTASAADDSGIARLALLIDGSELCAEGTTTLSCRWNTRKVSAGTHTITAQAEDPHGNLAEVHIQVDVAGKQKGGGRAKGR